jgi:hypothetical protein
MLEKRRIDERSFLRIRLFVQTGNTGGMITMGTAVWVFTPQGRRGLD